MNYTVYTKSAEQFREEKEANLRNIGYSGNLPSEICMTYIKNDSGEQIDTWALSLGQIASFYINQLSTSKGGIGILHCLNSGSHRYKKPAQVIKKYSQLKDLINLAKETNNRNVYDVIAYLDNDKLLEKAQIITHYQRTVEGKNVNLDDVINSFVNYENENSNEKF